MAHGVPTITTQIDIERDPALYLASHNKSMRAAWQASADYHHRQHMPRHFQSFAAAKYGYVRRSKKYNARKLKIIGHQTDNVFTGKTRLEVISKRKITGTPKGANLKVRLPISGGTGRAMDDAARARLHAAGKTKHKVATTKQINSQRTIIQRVAEIKAVSSDEINTCGKVAKQTYVNEANKPTSRRRITIST